MQFFSSGMPLYERRKAKKLIIAHSSAEDTDETMREKIALVFCRFRTVAVFGLGKFYWRPVLKMGLGIDGIKL